MIQAFFQLWAGGFLGTWILATGSRWRQGAFGAQSLGSVSKILLTDAGTCLILWPAVLVILITQDSGRPS